MIDKAHRRVIFASSLGTVFEWYDFSLYGSLAAIISRQFFAGVNETTAFIFALLCERNPLCFEQDAIAVHKICLPQDLS